MATRFVSNHPLRVAPELLGRPLASPARRLLAVLLDGLLLLLPTYAAVAAAAALTLRVGDPAGYRALRLLSSDSLSESAAPEALHDARRQAARLLTQIEAKDLPPAVACAVRDGRLDDAAAGLAGRRLGLVLRLDGQESSPRAGYVNVPVDTLIPGPIHAVVLLGVPALYFTLLTSFWGTTLGKRLFCLRVVRLDAERLSLPESFERFTGYLHIPALLGWPILDLWHNPNRQLPHDRTVHTVVVRSRRNDGHAKATVAVALPRVEHETAPSLQDRDQAPRRARRRSRSRHSNRPRPPNRSDEHMCGRFNLTAPGDLIAEEFGLDETPALRPRFNIAPSQPVATIGVQPRTGRRGLAELHWGFVLALESPLAHPRGSPPKARWHIRGCPLEARRHPRGLASGATGSQGGQRRYINARSETAGRSPAFRQAFAHRRCLIPATGFYEWQRAPGSRPQPWLFQMADGRPFAFAGLWEPAHASGALPSCLILTTEPNDLAREVHDRMPAIVAPEDYAAWLDPATTSATLLQPLLRVFPGQAMAAFPVGTAVNDPAVDDRSCIEPVPREAH